jgi:hypothetical protein
MKSKSPSGNSYAWLCVIAGALGIWDGLVNLETHHDPIFGALSRDSPEWCAAGVVVGIAFLFWGLTGLLKAAKRDDRNGDDSN